MKVNIPYGKKFLDFEYQPGQFDILSTQETKPLENINAKIIDSLYSPIILNPLDSFVSRKDKIGIILSDATRYTAADKIIPVLLEELIKADVKPKNIAFIISAGMHRQPTETEINTIIGQPAASQFPVYIHNAYDESMFYYLGTTSQDTPLYINKKVFDFDKLFIISSIGYHYFAGFSGGRKSLIPGLASINTIMANHKLVINRKTGEKNPGARIANLKDNPVHLDLMEGISKINIPIFCVNAILFEKKLIDIICGDLDFSFRAACKKYESIASVPIQHKYDIVIASSGGYPKDINVIQAHKSLEHASYFCKKGGVIIFIAHCPDGWGNKDFADWLKFKDLDTFRRYLLENYKVNGQTAYSWRLKAEQFTIIMISSLPLNYQKRLKVLLVRNLERAYAAALSRLSPSFQGAIIPFAWELIPEGGGQVFTSSQVTANVL
ncbi:MAG: hypothetical protein A2Y62_05745 [Candidatus Fischerbacteria bacterium RBG_13_37_8]|uniref:Uncharacterized protein n=1 Tax=Candidatus Fischerbacteria bacterium RBG_13_37_8 TaxID=1817863 RepID=A0A1F5VD83_9BACT|nr:MAG: hypothetical protein A2Y62_05745 [Candidatus Fischerbacteria bacterium RBG_13_37_8]